MISLATTLLCILISLLLAVYAASTAKFNYWKKKKVLHIKPLPIFGNYADNLMLRKHFGIVASDICKRFPQAPYIGTYYGTEPALIVKDPDMIKIVMTKDFFYFNGREISKYSTKELVTRNIFFSGGDYWKVVRQNLTPLFSSAKMRNMFHLIINCAHSFESMLDKELETSDDLEARTTLARYTMGSISSCVLGIDTHTMDDTTEENPFTAIGNAIFGTSDSRGLKNITRSMWPALFYGAGLRSFPKQIDTFFNSLLVGIFESRGYKPSIRNDFVDLILGFKQNKFLVGDRLSNIKTGDGAKATVEVTDELLVAQSLTLFGAGFETSATTLSFTLFELAKNQDAQKRAQADVDAYLKKHDNKLNYDCVTELPFLEACIDEALRLYPVLGTLTREVMEDYTMPCGLRLEKGIRVHIPVYWLQHNPDFFPEPEVYRPERFLAENKHNIIPYTYIPFGEGPRICIGMRFAKMQMLSGLVTVLKKYNLELAPGMSEKVPFEPRAIVSQPMAGVGIQLKCTLRDGWEDRAFDRTKAS